MQYRNHGRRGGSSGWRTAVRLFVLGLFASAFLTACADDSHTLVATPLTTSPGHLSGSSIKPLAGTSLREHVFDADVIARVRLSSTQLRAESAGTDDKGTAVYRGVIEYKFQALEYLKGSGGNELTVTSYLDRSLQVAERLRTTPESEYYSSPSDFVNPYTTKESALQAIQAWQRDTRWDDREAIILVPKLTSEGNIPFAGSDYRRALISSPTPQSAGLMTGGAAAATPTYTFGAVFGPSDDELYRTWLPAETSANGASSTSETRFLLEVPDRISSPGATASSSQLPNTTVTKLKAFIAALDAWVQKGGNDIAYLECVRDSFVLDALLNGMKERGESIGSSETFILDSGSPALMMIPDVQPRVNGRFWLTGPDTDLLAFTNGEVRNTRPLPRGKYLVYLNLQTPPYIACDYHPVEYVDAHRANFVVAAPSGTLHEAFFDPVSIGTTIGADGTNGVLKPNTFTASDSTTTTLHSIDYSGSSVRMLFSQTTGLSGKEVQFIMLDGTVGLTVPFSSATVETVVSQGTRYSWTTCSAPWVAGEKVMIRIRNASGGTSSTPSCIGVTPTATPVP